jgi:hypothetical protein
LYYKEFFSLQVEEGDAEYNMIIATQRPRDWMIIETFCFYTYILSTCFFIFIHQCKNWTKKAKDESDPGNTTDLRKIELDFVRYSRDSLIWFAFNFVCVVMPIIIVTVTYLRRFAGGRCETGKVCGQFTRNEVILLSIICI